jgi:pimeloyl-ACP methyl ester carboxylesterase
VVAAVAVLVLAALGLAASWSPSGWGKLAALAIVAGGMVSSPWRTARARGVTRAGAALFALVAVTHAVHAGSSKTATMPTLPGNASSRWLGLPVDEEDVGLLGARGIGWLWGLPPAERASVVAGMHNAYVAMREAEGATPSPVLDTLLGRQGPDAFDAVIIEPRERDPRAAVVFLHGYAGNFALACWLMAEAARAVDAVTVCPSTGFAGAWWTPDGERTVRAVLAYLEQRRVATVYLAGLSNGGIGASMLAERLAPSLAGLILVSGVSPRGSTADLPTIVIHGESDTQTSAAASRAFAARTGATYVGYDGGHFVMMVRRIEVRDAIAHWLRKAGAGT